MMNTCETMGRPVEERPILSFSIDSVQSICFPAPLPVRPCCSFVFVNRFLSPVLSIHIRTKPMQDRRRLCTDCGGSGSRLRSLIPLLTARDMAFRTSLLTEPLSSIIVDYGTDGRDALHLDPAAWVLSSCAASFTTNPLTVTNATSVPSSSFTVTS